MSECRLLKTQYQNNNSQFFHYSQFNNINFMYVIIIQKLEMRLQLCQFYVTFSLIYLKINF